MNCIREEGQLPYDFDIVMLVEAATLIVKWYFFAFEDFFFRQLLGTAMGTQVAVIWATIYFWWHEKHALIPKCWRMIPLLLRFIDAMFGIVLIGDNQKWTEFEKDLSNFEILK